MVSSDTRGRATGHYGEKAELQRQFTGCKGVMIKAMLGMQSRHAGSSAAGGKEVEWEASPQDPGPRLAEDLPRARSHCTDGD